MDKQELDYRISETAKSILSYCIARTSNQTDAEDLAQDIIVEIYKSSPNLRNVDAFYGFMWGIAGNVYKQWCKNKSKQKTCELDENISIDLFESDDSSFELNHIPPHLKKTAKDLAFLRLFEDAISAPVALLCERKFLLPYSGNSLLPTTYVVLK